MIVFLKMTLVILKDMLIMRTNDFLRSISQEIKSVSSSRERVKSDPYLTPTKTTTGILFRIGEVVGLVRDINPIFSNKDRVKYGYNAARATLCL